MRIKISKKWLAGAVALLLPVISGNWQNANAQSQPPPPTPSPASSAAPDTATALPTGVLPSSPLAQVITLTQSGVSEEVIMTYVTNSTSTFNLDPDKIIYLKDIGAPDDLVTAMIQRDQLLQAQMAAPAYQPPPQPEPGPEMAATEPEQSAMPVEEPAPVTVNYFYDTLAPYGGWVNVQGYGTCWRPTAVIYNSAWQPYCDHGHWVYSNCGWYWISDYSWGWAPFHYGRWVHDGRYGWCWTPDTVWAPSWVTWRYSAGYCGWAPLPPFTAYVSGVGFTYHGAAVGVNFAFGLGANAFVFVPTKNFCDPHPRQHRAEPRDVQQIYNQTVVVNNYNVDSHNRTVVNHGIDPVKITEVTHAPIQPVVIHETTTSGAQGERLGRGGKTLFVSRPRVPATPSPAKNQGGLPHSMTPSPAVGSPYQPLHPANENNNMRQARPNPPAPSTPAPVQYQMTKPADRAPMPVSRAAPGTPVQPPVPNNNAFNNSIDNRHYPSPRSQQIGQQSPGVYPGYNAGAARVPVTTPAPAAPQPATVRSSPYNYVSPRNQTPPSESRPSYAQPQPAANQPAGAVSSRPSSSAASQYNGAGNQSTGAPAPPPPPPPPPAPSQPSARGR